MKAKQWRTAKYLIQGLNWSALALYQVVHGEAVEKVIRIMDLLEELNRWIEDQEVSN